MPYWLNIAQPSRDILIACAYELPQKKCYRKQEILDSLPHNLCYRRKIIIRDIFYGEVIDGALLKKFV